MLSADGSAVQTPNDPSESHLRIGILVIAVGLIATCAFAFGMTRGSSSSASGTLTYTDLSAMRHVCAVDEHHRLIPDMSGVIVSAPEVDSEANPAFMVQTSTGHTYQFGVGDFHLLPGTNPDSFPYGHDYLVGVGHNGCR